MSDHERCPSSHHFLHGRQQIGFRAYIERAGGLIQDEQRSVFQDRARDSKPLPLASGKTRSALPDFAFVSLRKRQNKVMGTRGGCSSDDFGAAGIESSISDIVSNRGREQHRFLADNRKLLTQMRDAVTV